MKLPAAWTKRTGQPRCAQRVEIAMNSLGSSSRTALPLADVDRRLAGVADPVDDRDHRLAVRVGGEVVGRGRLPPRPPPGASKIGARAKPTTGSSTTAAAAAAELPGRRPRRRCGGSSSRPRTSPRAWASRGRRPGSSCPPRQPRKSGREARDEVYRLAARSSVCGPTKLARRRPLRRRASPPPEHRDRVRASPRAARRSPRRARRSRPAPTAAATVASQSALASSAHRAWSRPSTWIWAARLIRSESASTALEVAERGEPLEPERVEVVAGEQRQVGVGARDDPAVRVMEQVALAHRLDEQRVLAGLRAPGPLARGGDERRARARRQGRRRSGEITECSARSARQARAARHRLGHAGQRRDGARRSARARETHSSASANASAAASRCARSPPRRGRARRTRPRTATRAGRRRGRAGRGRRRRRRRGRRPRRAAKSRDRLRR